MLDGFNGLIEGGQLQQQEWLDCEATIVQVVTIPLRKDRGRRNSFEMHKNFKNMENMQRS